MKSMRQSWSENESLLTVGYHGSQIQISEFMKNYIRLGNLELVAKEIDSKLWLIWKKA